MAEIFSGQRKTLIQRTACHWSKVDVDPGFLLKPIWMPLLAPGKKFSGARHRSTGHGLPLRQGRRGSRFSIKTNINAFAGSWKNFLGARHGRPGNGFHRFRSVGDRAIFNRKIWIQNRIVLRIVRICSCFHWTFNGIPLVSSHALKPGGWGWWHPRPPQTQIKKTIKELSLSCPRSAEIHWKTPIGLNTNFVKTLFGKKQKEIRNPENSWRHTLPKPTSKKPWRHTQRHADDRRKFIEKLKLG